MSVAVETLRAAALSRVVGVDTDCILRAGVVYGARRLTHSADTSLGDPAVVVGKTHHCAREEQETERDREERETRRDHTHNVHVYTICTELCTRLCVGPSQKLDQHNKVN